MNHSTLFSVAPTFPLDDAAIRRRTREKIAASPATWLGFAAAVGIGLLAGTGAVGYLLLLGLAGFGLSLFWSSRRTRLDAASVGELIKESNAAQDRELARIIRQLRIDGQPQYALCLGRFLMLKQKIETQLHADPRLESCRVEIEKAVDGICAEICREITSLMERDGQLGELLTSRNPRRLERFEAARRESHAGILHAYTTLFQTHAELVSAPVTPPALDPVGEAPPELGTMIEALRDETGILTRARARIEGSLGVAASSESPPSPPPLVEA